MDFGFGVSGQHAASSEQTEYRSAREVKNAAWPGAKYFHICQQTQALPDQSSKGRGHTYSLGVEGKWKSSWGLKKDHCTLVENLQQSFEDRFCNLKQKRPLIIFLINSFAAESACLKAPFVGDEAESQLEIIKLSADDRLECVLGQGTAEFWKNRAHRRISKCQTGCPKDSVSAWINFRESVFHKILLCSYGHTWEWVAMATTVYKVDLKRTVGNKDCHGSHWENRGKKTVRCSCSMKQGGIFWGLGCCCAKWSLLQCFVFCFVFSVCTF